MLKKILETKQSEVQQLYASGYAYSLTVEERAIPSYPFIRALQKPKRSSGLIAEVKKASPSKGVIRPDFHPVEIAKAYEHAGADCLSVLTDKTFFQGDLSYIAQIKEQVKIPILRKDFIIDPIQVRQSIELGADAILLIAKALPINLLAELYHQAEEAGLDILIEITNQEELEAVFSKLSPLLIGINNRDLSTFQTSTDITKQLLPFIPKNVLVISESGIHSSEMVLDLEQHGVKGFLVGEHFMRQEDIGEAVSRLYARA
jgi:indole-3-glycerol phosphate synthase